MSRFTVTKQDGKQISTFAHEKGRNVKVCLHVTFEIMPFADMTV
jgi:hypothetical protein